MKIHDFALKKQKKQKISMVTCYDSTFAKLIDQSSIDCVLVGDSLAMVMHGYDTTLPATVDLMALHVAAVSRSMKSKFIVGDLPFLSYRSDLKTNIESALKVMQAGAHAIKIEGASGNLDFIRHCVDSGVPVMGHLGLTPQSFHQLGGYKVQAKLEQEQKKLVKDCLELESAGCFSIVLECVPQKIAQAISKKLKIPVIGIGAGAGVDGQVLVLQDLLGMNVDFKPKFVRKFLDGQQLILDALNTYHEQVNQSKFPNASESF